MIEPEITTDDLARCKRLLNEIIYWIETSTEKEPNSIRLDVSDLVILKRLPLLFAAYERVVEERDALRVHLAQYKCEPHP